MHDYLKEFGGAERVLRVLAEMWPEAPIHTAFVTPGSSAAEAFKDRKVIAWKHEWLIKRWNLHSPLRFLIPLIWESFDLSGYDVVISSASGYVTKGVLTQPDTAHICYCHTPPKFLYGYPTAVEWKRFWPVRVYGQLLIHYLRQYDYLAAQRVDEFVANSHVVEERIEKFYRLGAKVIYPPVEVKKIAKATKSAKVEDYYLVVSRVVGAKGWDILLGAAKELGLAVKIVGEPAGLRWNERRWKKASGEKVEWLGWVSEEELWRLYGGCKAYLAMASDEDFGMTVVEAMAAGRPVVAYAGGGYLETVVEGKTGTFFHDYSVEGLVKCLQRFKADNYRVGDCRKHAEKFSRERFEKEMRELVEREYAKIK